MHFGMGGWEGEGGREGEGGGGKGREGRGEGELYGQSPLCCHWPFECNYVVPTSFRV